MIAIPPNAELIDVGVTTAGEIQLSAASLIADGSRRSTGNQRAIPLLTRP
jgi:hypothetical protein